MKVNMVDFKDKSKEIIKSMKQRENVEVFYHKKRIGILISVDNADDKAKEINKLAFVGSRKNDGEDVESVMNNMRRKKRYDF